MAQLTLIEALGRYLPTVTALTDLVSTDPDTNTPNIRPGNVTQQTDLPYIGFEIIAEVSDQELDGTTCFTTRTIAFTIVSDSVLTNAKIAEQLRLNLNGFQRTLMPPNLTAAEGAIWVNSTRQTNAYGFPNSPQTGDQFTKYERTEIYDFGIPLDDNVVHPPNLV